MTCLSQEGHSHGVTSLPTACIQHFWSGSKMVWSGTAVGHKQGSAAILQSSQMALAHPTPPIAPPYLPESPHSHSHSELLCDDHSSKSASMGPNSACNLGDPQFIALPLPLPSGSPEDELYSHWFLPGGVDRVDGYRRSSGDIFWFLLSNSVRSSARLYAKMDAQPYLQLSLVFARESRSWDSALPFVAVTRPAPTFPGRLWLSCT